MQPMINPKYPGLSVRVADEGFAAYVWGSDFSFEVSAYAQAQSEQAVAKWPLHHITPYRKCYGIDPEEFSSYRDATDSAVFMAYLDDEPVGHVVVSTNWNGYAHIDELAVHAPARRHGWPRLCWMWRSSGAARKLPGIMLETQNNNLGPAACTSAAVMWSAASIICVIAGSIRPPPRWRFSGIGCSTTSWRGKPGSSWPACLRLFP